MEFEKVLTKVHKIEIMVVEFDEPFDEETFECDPAYYNPSVMSVESTEVYWDDITHLITIKQNTNILIISFIVLTKR